MQPLQLQERNTPESSETMPDLDDAKRQLALSWFFVRLLKGLDPSYYPKDFDKETQLYLRDLNKRLRSSKPPDPREMFMSPFFGPVRSD